MEAATGQTVVGEGIEDSLSDVEKSDIKRRQSVIKKHNERLDHAVNGVNIETMRADLKAFGYDVHVEKHANREGYPFMTLDLFPLPGTDVASAYASLTFAVNCDSKVHVHSIVVRNLAASGAPDTPFAGWAHHGTQEEEILDYQQREYFTISLKEGLKTAIANLKNKGFLKPRATADAEPHPTGTMA
jgi:hypothetical protein